MDFRATNPRVTAPTLVIVGKQDPATPPAAGEEIARQIKGAKLAALDAAHISNIEQPEAFTEAVLEFPAVGPSANEAAHIVARQDWLVSE